MKLETAWKRQPEEHDFPAAEDFLSLLVSKSTARDLVALLRKAHTTHRKAKDILRAGELGLLPKTNPHVANDLAKVKAGEKLSPVLLVRRIGRLLVADGYHRVCASYHLDENTDIPCRLV